MDWIHPSYPCLPLAIVVCVYGNLETMLLNNVTNLERILSIFGHVGIAILCLRYGRITKQGVAVAVSTLLVVLFTYHALQFWPYKISKVNSTVFVISLLMCLLMIAA